MIIAASSGGSPLGSLLIPLILVVGFYLLFLRPQRARARRVQEMQHSLVPGQEVMTTSGIFATVVEVEDDAVRLEIANGVTVRFARAAIARVTPLENPLPPDDLPPDDRPPPSGDHPGPA